MGPEIALKQGAPNMKTSPYEHVWELPERRLACALLKQERTVRVQKHARIGFRCPCIEKCSKTLFELASMANVPKRGSKQCKGSMSKAHY